MIFSAKKWNNGKELKAVMKVNTAISFDMMEAPLRNAFRQYLVPLLGDAMVTISVSAGASCPACFFLIMTDFQRGFNPRCRSFS